MTYLKPDVLQDILDRKAQLENCNDTHQILDLLYDLFDVEMTTAYLETTLIGKTVNTLRHDEYVGSVAQSLIRKWKNIVINEVEGEESDCDNDSDSCSDAGGQSEVDDMQSKLIEICHKAIPQIRITRLETQKFPMVHIPHHEKKVATNSNAQVPEVSSACVSKPECPVITSTMSNERYTKDNPIKYAYVDLKRYVGPSRLILKSSQGKGKKIMGKGCQANNYHNAGERLCQQVR